MGISREQRAARRLDRDGIGPVLHDRRVGAWPGAAGGFALWGEVLLTGIMVTIASLGVVTLPAALAAGSRHLTRYARSESSRWAEFWADVRAALPGGVGIGAVAAVLGTVLAVDISLARAGMLPAAAAIEAVSWLGLIAAGTVLLAAAGQWDQHAGWRAAVMRGLSQLRGDIGGAAYLVVTVAFVGVCTWALPALLVPALGCAAIATVAIPARPRRHHGEDLA